MVDHYLFFGLYVSMKPRIETAASVPRILNSLVNTKLGGRWRVVRDVKHWEIEEGVSNNNFYAFRERVVSLSESAAWDMASTIRDSITSELPLETEEISIEPLTDIGFAIDFESMSGVANLIPEIDLSEIPKKKSYKNSWCVDHIGAKTASQQHSVIGNGVRVGLLDTGYTNHHEIETEGDFLPSKGWNTYDKIQDPTDPMRFGLFAFKFKEPIPLKGHGTSTGSVLNSKINTNKASIDVIGVAPGAEVVPYRIGNSQILTSRFLRESVTESIRMAAGPNQEMCDVLSLSLGYMVGSRDMRRAIDEATEKGVIVVAAAGQVLRFASAPWHWIAQPAYYTNTIAVSASNYKKELCKWAFRGIWIDTVAPGQDVWRAYWKESIIPFVKKKDISAQSWGTSYAAPHVAGIVALWLERWAIDLKKINPAYRTCLFRFVLNNCGINPITDIPFWKWGLIDAVKVLDYDWRKNSAWQKICKQVSGIKYDYSWTEEFAINLPFHKYILDHVDFPTYYQAFVDVAKVYFEMETDKELEQFIGREFPKKVGWLFVKRSFLTDLLLSIVNILGLEPGDVFPDDINFLKEISTREMTLAYLGA